MTPITIAVPENKVTFFKELIRSLHFKEIESENTTYDIPEAIKKFIRKRVDESKEVDYVEWNTVRKTLHTE